jgi:hypothetical protein
MDWASSASSFLEELLVAARNTSTLNAIKITAIRTHGKSVKSVKYNRVNVGLRKLNAPSTNTDCLVARPRSMMLRTVQHSKHTKAMSVTRTKWPVMLACMCTPGDVLPSPEEVVTLLLRFSWSGFVSDGCAATVASLPPWFMDSFPTPLIPVVVVRPRGDGTITTLVVEPRIAGKDPDIALLKDPPTCGCEC